MPRVSAGVLLFRRRPQGVQVLLVHPGGPFWKNKDQGAWSLPKGEVEAGEDLLAAARRELEEELGLTPHGPFTPLSPIKQKGGKIVHAWACEGDCDPSTTRSNTFTLEWPPRSGKRAEFPEVDRAEWFSPEQAREKINPAQADWIQELEKIAAQDATGQSPRTA
jgi:predicted NUDIX family NTP pyrophosphohydrolase